MVVKRSLICDFDFINIPKGPRSSRRKPGGDCGGTSGIDLLASVAGKLLEETETSSNSNNALEGYYSQDHLVGAIKQDIPLAGCGNEKEDCEFNVESGGVTEEETCVVNNVDNGGLTADAFSLKDPSQLPVQPPVHLDGHVKLPTGTDSVNGYKNRSKLVRRDDDENNCKYYTKFSDKCNNKSYRPRLTWAGHRRAVPPRFKSFEDTKTDGCEYRKRKLSYGYSPKKHETLLPHKKRRLSHKRLVVNSDGGRSSDRVTNSTEKGEPVKFSIKSLRIPELLIEVPETETVGSLKRTVMDAVSALLDDGISIGLLVQGKKVRDDNNTLSQAGLSRGENLGNLGFTLEPGPGKPTDLARSAASLAANCVENNQELVPYQSDIPDDEQQPLSDSRALVPVSALEPDALAIVPYEEKPKRRTELSQRRTRRPFSVTEVEALVHAVEEFGTGRWRDVKRSSFDDASHRTYVDLKDKWKTLVHTASIAPQQRRGEPVPQELLDRVLAAHMYWSQHPLKQNGKHQAAETMLIEAGPSM